MKHFVMYLFYFTLTVTTLTGCVTTGVFQSMNLTNVVLSENNFKIVAKNVSGEASAGYLIGFSAAFGSDMKTFALIRVEGEGLLFKAALEDFWGNFEKQYGDVEGRNLAIVNVRYDSDALNVLLLYTKPKISIRADVVEFVD